MGEKADNLVGNFCGISVICERASELVTDGFLIYFVDVVLEFGGILIVE